MRYSGPKKRDTKRVVRAVLAGISLVCALGMIPHLSSGLFAAAALLLAPIPQLEEFVSRKIQLKRPVLNLLVAVMFFLGVFISPHDTGTTSPDVAQPQVSTQRQAAGQLPTRSASASTPQTDVVVSTDSVETANGADAQDAPQTPPQEEPVAQREPEQEPQPVAEPAQQTEPEPAPSVQEERTVYVTPTGEKYHKEYCRTIKNSKTAISLSDAISQGYTACGVCGG